MVIYSYMISVYAILVKAGKYTLTPDDNPNKLTPVPSEYIQKVAEYLAADNSAGADKSTTANA